MQHKTTGEAPGLAMNVVFRSPQRRWVDTSGGRDYKPGYIAVAETTLRQELCLHLQRHLRPSLALTSLTGLQGQSKSLQASTQRAQSPTIAFESSHNGAWYVNSRFRFEPTGSRN